MATLPVFRTWTAGEIVTAAFMNSNIRDPGNFFLSWPVFEGRQTVAQSLTSGVAAPVTFDVEDVDTDNGHSTVTNTDRYTCQTQGRFQISGGVGYASNITGFRGAEVWKNGSVVNGGGALANAVASGSASSRVPTKTMSQIMNGSTDYFQIGAVQSSGGALNTAVSGGFEQSSMSVRMVGTT